MKVPFEFKAKLWRYEAAGGWYFISLPTEVSQEIRTLFKKEEEGWGRLKVTAQIEQTQWETAIWFDTKQHTYLLPVKAAVRKKEKVSTGTDLKVIVFV